MTPHMDVPVSRAQDAQERPTVRGFALITAIFLVVVLASLAFYLTSLTGTQHFTSMWSIQGSRALYAARSGAQWGAFQAVNGGGCNGTLSINAGAGANFDVAVACTSDGPHDELGVETTVWTITSTAESGTYGGPGYVRRTVQTMVVSGP